MKYIGNYFNSIFQSVSLEETCGLPFASTHYCFAFLVFRQFQFPQASVHFRCLKPMSERMCAFPISDPLEAKFWKVVFTKIVALALFYLIFFENSKKSNIKISTPIFVKRHLGRRAEQFWRLVFIGIFFDFEFF